MMMMIIIIIIIMMMMKGKPYISHVAFADDGNNIFYIE